MLNGINELLKFRERDVMPVRNKIFVATEVSVRIGPRSGGPNARPKITSYVRLFDGVVSRRGVETSA